MSTLDQATGHCLCGKVRFTARDVETHYHSCHCSMCRRWGGGPAMAVQCASIEFEEDAGLGWYESSEWARRGFCKACGSSLFYHMKPSDSYIVWVGSLDDQTPFGMAGEIYIDAKPAGYAFAGDHPRMTEAEFMASLGLNSDGTPLG